MPAMAESPPTVSVIIPFYNARATLAAALAPLRAMLARGEIAEIIAVDDGSTDASVALASSDGRVRVVQRSVRAGPGAARNSGSAEARGDYLWFVDADVVVADDAARVLNAILAELRPEAVIGSYDDAPAARNFLSQYKNLVHSYYHHRGRRQASTFWSGCGAVRRDVFAASGGFDAERYPFPSIEDIDLGYRIRAAGGRIVLEPALQGKHLKEWRLVNLLHTEVFRRAIPWSLLMMERKEMTDDLNVGRGERVRALLVLFSLVAIVAALAGWLPAWAAIAMVAATVFANRALIGFFSARGGIWFALRAFLFHQFYYLYSSASFAAAAVQHMGTTRAAPT